MGSDLDADGDRSRSAPRLLGPIFGAPLGLKRKAARALVRAQVPVATAEERFVPSIEQLPGHVNGKTLGSPAMHVPAYLRYRDGTELERMANVPKRISQLVTEYWGFTLQPVHLKVLTLMFTGGYLDIMLPTEHGKSTLCNVVYTLLSLMNNPDAAHMICCTNLDDGKSWLRIIKMKLESRHVNSESAALLRDYPWLEKPTGSLKPWGAMEITIAGRSDPNNRNPSVAAMGQGSGDIKGRRAKFVGDDLEGKGAVRESARTELWEWITLEAMRTIEDVSVEPRRLFCNIGTPFDPDSIHFKLAELTRRDGSPIFTTYKQPYKDEKGKLIWPAKRQKIAELRDLWKDERQWQIAMELNPKGDNPFALTMTEIRDHAAAAKSLEETVATFVTLDPASGAKNARTDYAGIAVERINWAPGEILPNVDVVEAYKYTDEAWPQVIFAAELARKHKCPVVVEMNAMQRVYKGLFQQLAADIKVIPFYTTERNKFHKSMGLSALKTLIRVDRLRICATDGGETLKKEIRDLGTGAHDHIAFAVWFPIFYVYQFQRRQGQRKLVISNSPARNYAPLVGRRTVKIATPFQPRRYVPGSKPNDPWDRPMLRDENPG